VITVNKMLQDYDTSIKDLTNNGKGIELGKNLLDYFSSDVEEKVTTALEINTPQAFKNGQLAGASYDMDCIPLSGRFRGKGVVLVLIPLVAGCRDLP